MILVDDSSRVSRDLADALRIIQRLKFAGLRVIYISQGIDSASEVAETLIAVHGIVDSLYLREMAAKNARVGFVGLGHMGGNMAARLLAAGYPVYGEQRSREDAQDTKSTLPARHHHRLLLHRSREGGVERPALRQQTVSEGAQSESCRPRPRCSDSPPRDVRR